MENKLQIIAKIFGRAESEDSDPETLKDLPHAPLSHGKYYGGVYNGRKHMYSEIMIKTLSPEKLEAFIKKQIGYPTKD